MKAVRIILIILVILILLGFGGRYLIMYLMRIGLAKGWIDEIEGNSASRIADGSEGGSAQKKITIPEGVKSAIDRNLAKLGFKDLNTLVTFSKRMKAKDYVGALGMYKEVKPILIEKTDLSKISELGKFLFPGD